ncbi:MAG: hypothetical protein V4760_12920 [Bdellovibrionota bacterium]
MRKTIIASAIFFLLFTYGLVLSQNQLMVIPEELEPKHPVGFYDYKGVSNVHTDRGLGSGSPNDVIKAAQEVGHEFLILTDLNAFEKPALPEGYHRKLLVIGAGEYSYVDSRVLLYDLQRRHSLESLGQTQTILADLLSQSGVEEKQDLIVLAHPLKPGFAWSGAYPSGLDGLEVINLKSVWRARSSIRSTRHFHCSGSTKNPSVSSSSGINSRRLGTRSEWPAQKRPRDRRRSESVRSSFHRIKRLSVCCRITFYFARS